MPLYQFKCKSCEQESEHYIPASKLSKTPDICPKCNTIHSLVKCVTAPGVFILKGSGFYKPSADYK